MDEIKLKLNHTDEGAVVDIYINNQNLIDLLKEYELLFARKEGSPSIAGEYIGLDPEYIFSPSRHLLGEPAHPLLEYDGKISILECADCGLPGCWPFLVKISVEDDKVIWSDFEQPHRSTESSTHWNYDQFGPFIFDRQQYERELRHR